MSFGFSPSDVIKLVEISTRVYIAFKDANDNSQTQVEGLVCEFQHFARCLKELDELMKEFGRSMPFPVEDFKKTLDKCEACLKPYKENLVDKKMGVKKVVWTIKYIGKEKEIDGLRKLITGHYQALDLCLSFLSLRLNLESTKREQRLLVEPRSRAVSLGGQWFTNSAMSTPNTPLALPAAEDSHPLYKDWQMFNRWLKSEDERLAQELELARPTRSSWGDTPRPTGEGSEERANVLYHLRREVEDAILFEENRSKRAAVEKRSHLEPSDAMKRKVAAMPRVPTRTYTLETDHSGDFSGFKNHSVNMSDSTATLRPGPSTPSPKSTPIGSPEIEQEYFNDTHWSPGPSSPISIQNPSRASVSTTRSSVSIGSHLSPGLGIYTAETTPDSAMSHLHPTLSGAWMDPIVLPPSAMQWQSFVRKVDVERTSSKRVNERDHVVVEHQECDIHWKYRDDMGISLRAVFRSPKDGKPRVWIMQDFSATGPSIPLTTTMDREVCVDFPRGSFGRLDKQWTDVKYIFKPVEDSVPFQTLLYSNAGKDEAELLFDRSVKTISSDKHKPECRNRNIRLWKKKVMRLEADGSKWSEILMLLFYTSSLQEKGHWVEEPHYAFESLPDSIYEKESDTVKLSFSGHSTKWASFSRRKSSTASRSSNEVPTSPIMPAKRKDSMEIPGIMRTGTRDSILSDAASIRTTYSIFGKKGASARTGKLNCFGYTKLEIEFSSKKDRRAFLDVWKKFPSQ